VTKKSRRGGLIAIVSAITVVGIVLAAPRCSSDEPKRGPVEVTETTTLVPKPKAAPTTAIPKGLPQYVIVNKGDKVPNITPPTKLWFRGLTEEECADWGGTYDGSTGICHNVDY
jgi:hypothetical protein